MRTTTELSLIGKLQGENKGITDIRYLADIRRILAILANNRNTGINKVAYTNVCAIKQYDRVYMIWHHIVEFKWPNRTAHDNAILANNISEK